MDYADQRYHVPGTGRFLTPDPYTATPTRATNPANPGSWNRYAYVTSDPINLHDPGGRCGTEVSSTLNGESTGTASTDYSDCGSSGYDGGAGGAVEEYPNPGGAGGGVGGSGDEDQPLQQSQDLLKAIQGILDNALADSDCARIFGSSGGSLTAANVLDSLIQSTQAGGQNSLYGSIVFVDSILPGGAGAQTTTTFWGGIKRFFGLSSSSIVQISTVVTADFFNTSAYNAEVTILHELGHVLANLGWTGDAIVPDSARVDPTGQISTNNTSKIENACDKHLSK